MSNVKSYTTKQLLDRVATLKGFNGYPKDYWNIWVRSEEDAFNQFDDKVYLFKGEEFISVAPCTTNAGKQGLKDFDSYGQTGVAVLKSDVILYDSHRKGLHKGKVMAFRQDKVWPYYRDSNKDEKIDETGLVHNDKIIWANIHPATYLTESAATKQYINGWSLGCLVYANRQDFNRLMNLTVNQNALTNCVLKEF
jgi:hypothetical protein